MGSSIETAIVCSLVILIITFLIVKPEDICIDALDMASDGIEEVGFMLEESKVTEYRDIGGVMVSGTSPERFHTYISGLSDSYRIIYGAISG